MLFAKRFEDLPITQRIGDIIRVHRAYVGSFKGVKQFTANIFFNSSWALFSPLHPKAEEETKSGPKKQVSEREFTPFSFFGHRFSFEKKEQKVIKSLRDWVSRTFTKHQVLSNKYITKLEDISHVGARKEDTGRYYDIDLQVKVA